MDGGTDNKMYSQQTQTYAQSAGYQPYSAAGYNSQQGSAQQGQYGQEGFKSECNQNWTGYYGQSYEGIQAPECDNVKQEPANNKFAQLEKWRPRQEHLDREFRAMMTTFDHAINSISPASDKFTKRHKSGGSSGASSSPSSTRSPETPSLSPDMSAFPKAAQGGASKQGRYCWSDNYSDISDDSVTSPDSSGQTAVGELAGGDFLQTFGPPPSVAASMPTAATPSAAAPTAPGTPHYTWQQNSLGTGQTASYSQEQAGPDNSVNFVNAPAMTQSTVLPSTADVILSAGKAAGEAVQGSIAAGSEEKKTLLARPKDGEFILPTDIPVDSLGGGGQPSSPLLAFSDILDTAPLDFEPFDPALTALDDDDDILASFVPDSDVTLSSVLTTPKMKGSFSWEVDDSCDKLVSPGEVCCRDAAIVGEQQPPVEVANGDSLQKKASDNVKNDSDDDITSIEELYQKYFNSE